ncbi:2-dehydropantoate 2-reductase [Virgibacillus sp. W0181]|uniref:2-dehydropantoate 2-reductase n=1 Tax=Virgibacillus sp. W0181 TaxID=3391581 RepID=UPI003F46327A
MKIGIIGGGSIGLLLSSYLGVHHELTIYVKRKDQMFSLNDQGVNLIDQCTVPVKAKLINQLQAEDLLIVCVKQSHIREVIKYINALDDKVRVLFLQNGMGHMEGVEDIAEQIYVGVVEHGAIRRSDTSVVHSGKGIITIAVYRGSKKQMEVLANHLNQESFPFAVSSDWGKLLADKLLINAVINPLTALFNVKNSHIIENQSIEFLAKKLCKEACLALNLDYGTQWKRVTEVAFKTGNNTSSMLEDILRYRKTENEAISLYILKQSNVELPYTTFVYRSIMALEDKKGIL